MIFDIRIYMLVGIFMTLCISLMFFNFVIIRYSRKRNTLSSDMVEKWKNILFEQTIRATDKKINESKHDRLLSKKLSATIELDAYAHALQYLRKEYEEHYFDYMKKRNVVFQKLANTYSRKSNLKRTFFADFISNFPQAASGIYQKLVVGSLTSYIHKSTVHCRTTVMHALCSIGNIQGVITALQVINNESLFVHDQLLANMLSRFRGDKEILMNELWNDDRRWNDNILVAIIQFITRFSDEYGSAFLAILKNPSSNFEVRIAIIRYYEKHMYGPARPILDELVANSADIHLAAEAVLALERNGLFVPVKQSGKTVLLQQGNDDRTKEMLAYILGLKGASQDMGRREMDGEKTSA